MRETGGGLGDTSAGAKRVSRSTTGADTCAVRKSG